MALGKAASSAAAHARRGRVAAVHGAVGVNGRQPYPNNRGADGAYRYSKGLLDHSAPDARSALGDQGDLVRAIWSRWHSLDDVAKVHLATPDSGVADSSDPPQER